ncbi:MAG: hypothetical protein WAN36_17100 [Calditrichia bacterium]
MKKPARIIPFIILWLMVFGCSGKEQVPRNQTLPPAADTAPTPDSAVPDTVVGDTVQWTAGILQRQAPAGLTMANLTEVRTGKHENYERVVFQFSGENMPGFHLEYIDTPVRECASGRPVEAAGDGWLEVKFNPAQAHELDLPQGSRYKPGLPLLKELIRTCDFEGHLTWVLALASPNRYRIQQLNNPARLVLDIQYE